jgi:signal transduction histidine kinase
MTPREILYVDDEQDNLIVFQAAFEDAFHVWTTSSGHAALELLERKSFPVVVADQRMADISGTELFAAMRCMGIQSKRVLLTGYADSAAMLDAINQGQVYHFIRKPWEREDVFSVLVRAIEAYDLAISNSALTDRLIQMDRSATLGRAAARLAHEIGNQLGIRPLVELVEEQYAHCEDLVQTASLARNACDRLAELVEEVKRFIRFEREDVSLQPLCLAGAIQELVEFLRYDRSLPMQQVDLRIEVEGGLAAKASKLKLQQVLVNLLKNAAFAIRERAEGRIVITLARDADHAVLSVEDNGCGMSPEIAARIWEPFFTTKGEEGTGLGLDIARSIVQSHGGTIDCLTALNEGSTFVIRLPLSQSQASALGPEPVVFSASDLPSGSFPMHVEH